MYCPNCGTKSESEKSVYCYKCGVRIAEHPSSMNARKGTWRTSNRLSKTDLIVLGIFLVTMAFAVPAVGIWLFGRCGAFRVYQGLKVLDTYETHLLQIENATVDYVRPPSYMISQIDGDYAAISQTEFEGCLQPSARFMQEALFSASSYFGELPLEKTTNENLRRVILQRRYDYEDALRSYYGEVNILKTCQPFCNMQEVFSLGQAE